MGHINNIAHSNDIEYANDIVHNDDTAEVQLGKMNSGKHAKSLTPNA